MSRALSLLAAFASPVFMVAAIAGWLYGVWPANPLTFAVSALLVVGGPVLGLVHVATASDLWGRDEAPVAGAPRAAAAPRSASAARPAAAHLAAPRVAPAATSPRLAAAGHPAPPRLAAAAHPAAAAHVTAPEPAPLPLTPRAAAARRFAKWRSSPHPAIELRERERRAARHLRG